MIRVVKVGGRVQSDPRLCGMIAGAASDGDELIVVHGGGEQVSALQRRLGMEPRFSGGRRLTSPDELEVVRMVLSGSANKRLVAGLAAAGARAVGLSGEDAGLLGARVATGAPLGRVGERVTADPAILQHLLAGGWIPVVSPLARDLGDARAAGLNVNGDDAAAAIAIALRAAELTFLADVPGVLVNGTVINSLAPDEIAHLVANGVATGGMAAKLQAACNAAAGGVRRVRVVGLSELHIAGAGTRIIQSREMVVWEQ